jgi:hypothetical protein
VCLCMGPGCHSTFQWRYSGRSTPRDRSESPNWADHVIAGPSVTRGSVHLGELRGDVERKSSGLIQDEAGLPTLQGSCHPSEVLPNSSLLGPMEFDSSVCTERVGRFVPSREIEIAIRRIEIVVELSCIDLAKPTSPED